MTKKQAELAARLLHEVAYPDVEVENYNSDDGPLCDNWTVSAGGIEADSISELVNQLREDFPDDASFVNICAALEAHDDIEG
ncbi:MAG: hypothetical protein JO036_07450 [Candidatus Eremiobacteraeota bacterium]|nr:hypothetical protein [Candidatus Eremiobacteraeota bacterium]